MRRKLILFALLMSLLALALIPVCAWAEEDDVTLSLEQVTPDSMSAAGNVTVTFTVKLAMNAADPMESVSISKNGTTITSVNDVKPGYSPTFSVSVPLSENEIGSSVRLTLSWKQGGVSYSRDLPAFTVKRAEASVKVSFTRSADPTSVMPGEKVNFKYRVVNTGNVALSNLSVSDGSLGRVGSKDSLGAGATWEFSAQKTVTEAFTSAPVLTYTAVGSQKTEKLSGIDITLASAKLSAKLKASSDKVDKGTVVTLTCKAENTGSLDFQSLSVKDEKLGQLFTSPRLSTDSSTSFTKKVTVEETSSFTFVITAVDEKGVAHTYKSNTVKVSVNDPAPTASADASAAPTATPEPQVSGTLAVYAQADTSRMQQEQEVVLHLTIANETAGPLTDVRIKDDRDDTILTLEHLSVGTTQTDVEFRVGRERVMTLYMSGRDSSGTLWETVSDPVEIRYAAAQTTPSPEPEATVSPEAVQPTVVPEATQQAETVIPADDSENPNGFREIFKIAAIVIAGLAVLIAAVFLLPGIVENGRMMRSQRERLRRNPTRRTSGDKHRRNRRR